MWTRNIRWLKFFTIIFQNYESYSNSCWSGFHHTPNDEVFIYIPKQKIEKKISDQYFVGRLVRRKAAGYEVWKCYKRMGDWILTFVSQPRVFQPSGKIWKGDGSEMPIRTSCLKNNKVTPFPFLLAIWVLVYLSKCKGWTQIWMYERSSFLHKPAPEQIFVPFH